MKKFMLRGYEKEAITEYMPKSLEYGVWYDLVTPFDWQYFKLNKSSRYVCIYDDIDDKNPAFIVSRKKFVQNTLTWAKGYPKPVEAEDYPYKDLIRRNYMAE